MFSSPWDKESISGLADKCHCLAERWWKILGSRAISITGESFHSTARSAADHSIFFSLCKLCQIVVLFVTFFFISFFLSFNIEVYKCLSSSSSGWFTYKRVISCGKNSLADQILSDIKCHLNDITSILCWAMSCSVTMHTVINSYASAPQL